jgi:hypothetical protein
MKHGLALLVIASVLLSFAALHAQKATPVAAVHSTARDPVQIAATATGMTFLPMVQTIPGGEIDWTRGVVSAVGVGRAREDLGGKRAASMAKRAAYIVAARNAALVLAGIRVGPGGRFKNVRNGWIRADVKLTNFRETEANYNPATRTATARIEMPLYGVSGAVSVLGLETDKPEKLWKWPETRKSEATDLEVILLDARDVTMKPTVLPRLETVDGQCVFDAGRLGMTRSTSLSIRYVTIRHGKSIPGESRRVVHGRTYRCITIKPARCDEDGAFVLDQSGLNTLSRNIQSKALLERGRMVILTD